MDTAMADSIGAVNYTSSSAAVEAKIDDKKFIRTGDVKFKVNDVVHATYAIENTIAKFHGFITTTDLASHIDHHSIEKVSADSSLETTQYSVNNNMTFRVPNAKLDTVLKSIGSLVEYMDYRIIKAEDVTLQLLGNEIRLGRISDYEKRLKKGIDNRGGKLPDLVDAEENILNKQEQADNSFIANQYLDDQIEYSTVNLTIYQKAETKRALIVNADNIKEFEPWFGKKLVESLVDGWEILEVFILFMARFWGFILLGGIIMILVKRYRYKIPAIK
jgi:hypothetical protein